MKFYTKPLLIFSLIMAMLACSNQEQEVKSKNNNDIFAEYLDDLVAIAPEASTYLGLGGDYKALDARLLTYSNDELDQIVSFREKYTSLFKNMDKSNFSDSEKTHMAVLLNAMELANERDNFDFGFSSIYAVANPYIITPISGVHIELPQLLLVQHPFNNSDDVENFLARLEKLADIYNNTSLIVMSDAEKGMILPKFALEKTIMGIKLFLETGVDSSSLVTIAMEKVNNISDLTDDEKKNIENMIKTMIRESVFPSLRNLQETLSSLVELSSDDAGIWARPKGEEFYKLALKNYGAGDLTAEDIHNIGLAETKRIHAEMDVILKSMGFVEGDVIERMIQATESSDDAFYPDNEEGRSELLDELRKQINEINNIADQYFMDLPPYDVEVRRIPIYEEASAPGGYYTSPSLSGDRPGIYWINLKDMEDWAKYRLKTLTYHEAVPGHHFQLSSQLAVENFPKARQLLYYSEYGEGWALYAEKLAKEMGLYENDPKGDLGRLQAELFRAGRLVVDTGMHYKKWSREQAIDWLHKNTGEPINAATREIERYAVWPGQATSYKLGMIKILELRGIAQKELGASFDIKKFHKLVLSLGGVPLPLLESKFYAWLEMEKNMMN